MTELHILLSKVDSSAWSVFLVKAYEHLQIPFATLSFALFATSFTAMSTLTRIKDKLYDDAEYQRRVDRSRAIDETVREYKSYSQLEKAFLRMRLLCLGSGLLNIICGIYENWWTASIATVVFFFLLFRTARVAWFFHVNLAEIVLLDQYKLDEKRFKQKAEWAATSKPFARIEP